jgi:hypothetical protein
MHQKYIFILIDEGRGDGAEGRGRGRIITMVGEFGEKAPQKTIWGPDPCPT